MANVKINLLDIHKTLVIEINTDIGPVNTLIDTGAYMPVWNGSTETLLLYYPNAVETEYTTTISGFGGESNSFYDIWCIPCITLKDRSNDNEFRIRNLLVAIINDKKLGYDLILSSTTFDKVDYHIINTLVTKYIQIDYTRDLFCKQINHTNGNGEIITHNNKKCIKGIFVFFQNITKAKNITIECICVHRYIERNKIIGYKLQDKNGAIKIFSSVELKQLIKDNKIKVNNLVLTSDNRLITLKSY